MLFTDLMKWAGLNLRRVIPGVARDLLFLRWSIGLCVIVFLIVFSLRAQAPEPVPLAHGNVPGEPHHQLKIENEYIRAYYVEAPPHQATLLHQHDHDYLFVTLGDSDVMNEVLGKPAAHLVLKDGEVHFTRGGFAHVARNLSDAPFRNVTIELMKPQGEVHNLCEKIVVGELGRCQPFQNKSLLGKEYGETQETLIYSGTLKPRAQFTEIGRDDHLLVAMNQAELELAFPDPRNGPKPIQPTTRLGPGNMYWVQANRVETITNLRKEPSSYLIILFKNSGQPKK